MTTNIKEIEIELSNGTIEKHIVIDHGNEQFTSMPKATYDEQQAQAEHFTPIVTDAD
jgi:hypothetical protein